MNRARAACALALSTFILLTIVVQPVAANTRLDTLYAYLAERYNPDDEGGYSYPGTVYSSTEPTYSAAYALDEMGYLDSRPPFIDLVSMKNFTQKMQWEGGGVEKYGGFSDHLAGPVTMASSFAAIRLWEVLSQHNDILKMDQVKINETALLVYVNETHSSSGGFGSKVGDPPDVLSTYRALFLLYFASNALAGLQPEENISRWLPNPDNTTAWILSCQEGNAFKLSPDSLVPGITATAAAIMALDLLDQLSSRPDLQGMKDWILARQLEEPLSGQFVGGFAEGINTNDTNLVSTYYAIRALDSLVAVDELNTTAAVGFILSCQANDGSWGFTPGLPAGAIASIQYAIESLGLLGQDPKTALLTEDPNNPTPILLDWRLVFVVGFIAIALVLAVVSVRRS